MIIYSNIDDLILIMMIYSNLVLFMTIKIPPCPLLFSSPRGHVDLTASPTVKRLALGCVSSPLWPDSQDVGSRKLEPTLFYHCFDLGLITA